MGRPSNSAQRRQQIVEATVVVMARAGFDGASVQAIAKQAGLSPGLLHHHFGNKHEILLAVLDHLEALLEGRYQARVGRRRGPWGRLEAWVDAHLAVGEDASPEAAAVWVWIGAQALRDPELRRRYAALVERRVQVLASLVDAYAQSEGLRVDPRAVSVATLAAIEGFYQLACSTEVVETESAAAQVRRLLRLQLGRTR
jgi:TetR/AcrR family transcriptional repressor of bet genes